MEQDEGAYVDTDMCDISRLELVNGLMLTPGHEKLL